MGMTSLNAKSQGYNKILANNTSAAIVEREPTRNSRNLVNGVVHIQNKVSIFKQCRFNFQKQTIDKRRLEHR